MSSDPTAQPPHKRVMSRLGQVSELATSPELIEQRNVAERLDALRDAIFEELWCQLPLPRQAANSHTSVDTVARSYKDSHELLVSIREAALKMIRGLCESHVRLQRDPAARMDQLAKTREQEVERLQAHAHLPTVAVSPKLEAELFGEDAGVAYHLLLGDLRSATRALVDGFVAELNRLVERKLLGVITWPVDSACRFRFYQTQIVESGVKTHVSRKYADDGSGYTRTVTKTGQHDLYESTHQHQLTGAARHALPEYQQFIPQRIRDLLDVIPSWLRPHVEVVDGDLFRTDVAHKHCKTMEWAKTESEEWVETQPQYHPDPAITLGDYFVLGAWNSEERDAELERMETEKATQRQDSAAHDLVSQSRAGGHLIMALGLQIIPLVLHCLGRFFWPSLHGIALGMSLVLLFPVYFALRELALARQVIPGAIYYLLGVMSAVLFIVAAHFMMLAIVETSPAMVLAMLVSGAVSLGMGYQAMGELRAGQQLSSAD